MMALPAPNKKIRACHKACRKRSGIYSEIATELRTSAKALLKTWKKFNGNHAMYPQRNGKRIDLDDNGNGAVQEEETA